MRAELMDRLESLGDRPVVIDRGAAHTYDELAADIRRLDETFAASGMRPHEAVVLNGDFSFMSIAALLALFLRRNVVVPVVTITEQALATVTESCAPTHVVRPDDDLAIEALAGERRPRTDQYARLAASDAAGLVLLSSGSTGAPKAILHNLDAIVADKLERRRRPSRKPVNILMFLLFDHIGGINSLLGALASGGTAVVTPERSPDETCALIERYDVPLLPTSPTFLNLMLMGNYHEKYDLSSLRLITYGTEAMPEELLKRVHAAFPHARLLQTFGTSETGIATTRSESSSSTYFRIEDEGVQYRIVDGELQLKSDTQFLGYLNYSSDALTEDSWFKTGDLAEENEDGFIRITGRAKELINVGGEKVLPLELESILMSSPLIDDCVVYGQPNAITGQAVCADIKPRGDMSRADVRRHVREFLSGKVDQFKVPARINVVDRVSISERFKKTRSVA